ncbi:MAG: class I SAM-dependent methyltransferase [Actinomycetota bacterium]
MTRIAVCRGCGSPNFEVFLDLGETPLADALVTDPDAPEERFPLQVAFCEECSLVQITEDVEPEKLFVDNYLYFSSFSDHLLRHSRDHALGLIEQQDLGADSFVVEIASNDGYLLKNFVEQDVPVLGLDPAPDQAAKANEIGVRTEADFFTLAKARQVREQHGPADVIIANNVMAHIPDLNDFVAGMAHLIADDGVITVENPSVGELISRCAFDTIYHEHYFYHSCLSVDTLMRRHGLFLNDVEMFPDLHGGTNRWWIGKHEAPTERLAEALAAEREAGLDRHAYYADFGQRVEQLRDDLMKIVNGALADGKTIAAYGAAAKGATMLNVMGITSELVPYVVDRNTYKQGRYMPGTHQLIKDPEVLVTDPPDILLILAWNFAEEIMAQQQAYADAGGRFLIPVPTPELI